MDEWVTLTIKERKRVHAIHEGEAGRLTGKKAAGMLSLLLRQMRRLIGSHRRVGDAALAHGNRVVHRSERRIDIFAAGHRPKSSR